MLKEFVKIANNSDFESSSQQQAPFSLVGRRRGRPTLGPNNTTYRHPRQSDGAARWRKYSTRTGRETAAAPRGAPISARLVLLLLDRRVAAAGPFHVTVEVVLVSGATVSDGDCVRYLYV